MAAAFKTAAIKIKTTMIKVSASFRSESNNAIEAYTVKSDTVWKRPLWFPKKCCSLDDKFLSLPEWLYRERFKYVQKYEKLFQQDECATDSFDYFKDCVVEKANYKFEDIIQKGYTHIHERKIQYFYKEYMLELRGDDPFWSLYKFSV